jgi:hypothetical protein
MIGTSFRNSQLVLGATATCGAVSPVLTCQSLQLRVHDMVPACSNVSKLTNLQLLRLYKMTLEVEESRLAYCNIEVAFIYQMSSPPKAKFVSPDESRISGKLRHHRHPIARFSARAPPAAPCQLTFSEARLDNHTQATIHIWLICAHL